MVPMFFQEAGSTPSDHVILLLLCSLVKNIYHRSISSLIAITLMQDHLPLTCVILGALQLLPSSLPPGPPTADLYLSAQLQLEVGWVCGLLTLNL